MKNLWKTAFCALLVVSCGKTDNKDEEHADGNVMVCNEGCCGSDCSSSNQNTQNDTVSKLKATADLSDAFGLLVIDKDSNSAALNLMSTHNDIVQKLELDAPMFEIPTNHDGLGLTDAPNAYMLGDDLFQFPSPQGGLGLDTSAETSGAVLQKLDKNTGKVKDALTQDTTDSSNQFNPNQTLPKLLTLAISPKGDVYLHFERPFIYKDAPQKDNPFDQANGYMCQIFKVAGGTLKTLTAGAPEADNLTCVDNLHFINQWNTFQNGVFQFDDDANLYYPGAIPNSNKTVIYRRSQDGNTVKEVVNSGICPQNFLPTPSGGVFYTGQTCQTNGSGGQQGGQGGFFRYVSPGTSGAVIEIARDWSNFIFDTAVSSSKTDSAVFFGPDPRNATTASWNSACLFKFDPSKSDPSTRISEVITCGNNINDWMDLRRTVDVTDFGEGYHNYTGTDNNRAPSTAWRKEYSRRCGSKAEVFAGGGSQISAIHQDSGGGIYVIGNVRKKNEGSVSCSLELRGPHCTISGMPYLANSSGTAYSSTTCVNAGGLWISKGRCSNGSTDAACIAHSRTWNPGFCTNSSYKTESTCTGGGASWRLGSCSSGGHATESLCTSNGQTWTADNWSGSCTSTDSADNASLHHNDKNACIPEWQTENTWYDNVTNSLCTDDETGSRTTWNNWDSKDNNFAQTASSTRSAYSSLTGKFLVRNFSCVQASGATGDWTTEYSALAKVDATTKNLTLLSLSSEKAINLWLIDDKPYYSSFDTTLGQYLLSGLGTVDVCVDTKKDSSGCTGTGRSWTERKCVDSNYTTEDTCKAADLNWFAVAPYQVISNFETYNLSGSASSDALIADGLNFENNAYMFGSIDLAKKTISLKEGLTGTLKTIVILPKTLQ